MTKNSEVTESTAAESTISVYEGRKFAPFKHSFRDPWNDTDVELNFRFSKPTEPQIKRLQNTAGRDSATASRNLLMGTIHPEDKEKLVQTIEEYPGIVTSYATVLIKSVGISADLGN